MSGPIELRMMDVANKTFAKTFVDYLENHEKFIKNFRLLLNGLDKKQQDLLKNIYSRANFVHHSPVYSILNYTEEEKQEQIRHRQNFPPKLIREGNFFRYENYILPDNLFEISVFFYELGINYLKHPENIKGKDFLDVGAFIGDSALILNKLNPEKIYAFEPVANLYDKMNTTFEINNITDVAVPIKFGLGKEETQLEIGVMNSQSSTQTWTNNQNVQKELINITTIDKFVFDNDLDVGLIKIDTESCELDIIEGAVETIKKFKPVLILSIYHTAVDFFELKPFIEALNLGYTFNAVKLDPFNFLSETMLIGETTQ